jgi:hypothetical protein
MLPKADLVPGKYQANRTARTVVAVAFVWLVVRLHQCRPGCYTAGYDRNQLAEVRERYGLVSDPSSGSAAGATRACERVREAIT